MPAFGFNLRLWPGHRVRPGKSGWLTKRGNTSLLKSKFVQSGDPFSLKLRVSACCPDKFQATDRACIAKHMPTMIAFLKSTADVHYQVVRSYQRQQMSAGNFNVI